MVFSSALDWLNYQKYLENVSFEFEFKINVKLK